MNSKLIKSLSLVCLVLLSVISLEWFYAKQSKKHLLTHIQKKNQQTLYDEMPRLTLNQPLEVEYADLVDRPLFVQGRRPVAESSTPTANVTHVFDWRLSGVYTASNKGLMALLTREHPETDENPLPATATVTKIVRYRKVMVGSDIDGWTVMEIHPDKMSFMRGSIEKELLLRKKHKVKETQQVNRSLPFNSGRAMRMRPMPEPISAPQPELPDDAKNDNQ